MLPQHHILQPPRSNKQLCQPHATVLSRHVVQLELSARLQLRFQNRRFHK